MLIIPIYKKRLLHVFKILESSQENLRVGMHFQGGLAMPKKLLWFRDIFRETPLMESVFYLSCMLKACGSTKKGLCVNYFLLDFSVVS